MSEYIMRTKEHERKRNLLENHYNSIVTDDVVVSNLDFKKISSSNDGSTLVIIRYVTEYSLSEDEFDEMIDKLES